MDLVLQRLSAVRYQTSEVIYCTVCMYVRTST
jgi:hypothetical protein